MLDLEALLAPVPGDAPSGPDLEYDPEWQELERLAQGKPEQQFGDTIIPAEEPDWREVRSRGEALFARSKDARNAVLLARALSNQEQFHGVAQGLELIHQLMERFWDTVHPQLDSSDNDDPTMRLNALSALADPQGLLRSVRSARLFQSRTHGELTVRQIEIAAGKQTPRAGEEVPAQATIDQQLAAVLREDASLPARASEALAAARAIGRFLDEKVGSDRSPDLKPLIASLTTVDQLVGRIAATVNGAAAGEGGSGDAAGGDSPGSSAGPGINAGGAIRSRADVALLLDRIAEYLQRTEPTNPARMLVNRAKLIMDMDFIQLINELAPDGISQARTVTGVKEESSE
jgi:type VI secretion system protein ImpA